MSYTVVFDRLLPYLSSFCVILHANVCTFSLFLVTWYLLSQLDFQRFCSCFAFVSRTNFEPVGQKNAQKKLCALIAQSLRCLPVRYRSFFRISSGLIGDRSAGAISNSVLHPKTSRACIRPMALAQATRTDAVNSGLESSFRENSIT